MLNFYTASEAQLASLDKVGAGTAKKLINLRNEVKHGMRDTVTVADLAAVRLSEAEWSNFIKEGKLSLEMPADFVEGATAGPVPAVKPKTEAAGTLSGGAKPEDPVTMGMLKELMEQQSKNLDKTVLGIQTHFESQLNEVDKKWDSVFSKFHGTVMGHDDNFNKLFEKVTALEAAVAGKATAIPAALKPPEGSEPAGEIIEADLKPTPKVTADDWIAKLSSVHPKGGVYGTSKEPPKDKFPTEEKVDFSETGDKGKSKDRSRSPQPPKMELFFGDPSRDSKWSAFLAKFERQAKHRDWSADKMLNRLFDCLSGTALEYANKCAGNDKYVTLVKEMGQRFDLKDTPIAARQNLHIIKQTEDECIEAFLQRVMTVATEGYGMADSHTLQHVAAEAFLRGCRHKEAATIVLNEGPSNIQSACQRLKTLVANKRAVCGGSKGVSFQERAFSLEEENRFSRLEKSVESIKDLLKGSPQASPKQFRPSSPNQGYSNQPPPRYNQDNRGRSPTRAPYGQNFQNRTGYSPSPNRYNNYVPNYRPPSPQPTYRGQYPPYHEYVVPPYGPPNPYQGNPTPFYPPAGGRPWGGYSQGYNRGSQPRSQSPRNDGYTTPQNPYTAGPGSYNKGSGQSPDRSPGPKPPDFKPAHLSAPTPDRPLNYNGLGASATTP